MNRYMLTLASLPPSPRIFLIGGWQYSDGGENVRRPTRASRRIGAEKGRARPFGHVYSRI